jgi:hypothetical protein
MDVWKNDDGLRYVTKKRETPQSTLGLAVESIREDADRNSLGRIEEFLHERTRKVREGIFLMSRISASSVRRWGSARFREAPNPSAGSSLASRTLMEARPLATSTSMTCRSRSSGSASPGSSVLSADPRTTCQACFGR